MAYKHLNASLSLSKTPKEAYVEQFQEYVNNTFYNANNWYTIKEETPVGSGTFEDIDVRVVHGVFGETGLNQMDDYKTILFKDISHKVKIGGYYFFDNNYWIIINTDTIKSLNANAILKRCNNTLRWMNESGAYYSLPCSIEYQIQENRDYSTAGSSLVIPSGFIQVIVQHNAYTNTIHPNQRFLFGNPSHWVAYKLLGGGINNFNNMQTIDNMSFGFMRLTLGTNYINDDTDDLTNGIADVWHNAYQINLSESVVSGNVGQSISLIAELSLNGSTISRSLTWVSSNPNVATVNSSGLVSFVGLGDCEITCNLANNETVKDVTVVHVIDSPTTIYQVVINPNKNYILENTTQVYEVLLYSNGVLLPDEFTFTLSSGDVPQDCFQFDVIDGNHFSVSNRKMYLNSGLAVNCQSGINEKIINIILRGSW